MPSISLRMWPTSFWDAYYLSYIEYIQSGVCQYEIMDFCYVILRGPVFGAPGRYETSFWSIPIAYEFRPESYAR